MARINLLPWRALLREQRRRRFLAVLAVLSVLAVAGLFAFADGLTGYFASRRNPDVSGTRWGLDLYGSGGIMASNPKWCLSLEEWQKTFAAWIDHGSPEDVVALAQAQASQDVLYASTHGAHQASHRAGRVGESHRSSS